MTASVIFGGLRPRAALVRASLLICGAFLASCATSVIDLESAGKKTGELRDGGDDAPTDGGGSAADGGSCTTSADCGLHGGVCDPSSGRCVECLSDTECTRPWATHCDVPTHSCAPCFAGGTCPPGTSCGPEQTWCGLPCTSNDECFALLPLCDERHGLCVQCRSDEDCRSQFFGTVGQLCASGICVQCVDDSDCTEPAPFCSSRRGTCVECRGPSDCAPEQQCFEGRCGSPR